MGNSSLIDRKAQSFLEANFMLVAAIIMVLGITRIGLWYNSNIAQRQPEYNNSRLESAGEDTGDIGQWPVYERRNLTEDWVLKGRNFGGRKSVQKNGGDFDNRSDYDYDDSHISNALNDITASQEAYKNASELDYEAYELDTEADELDEEAEQLDADAVELDTLAEEQEQLYNNCMATVHWGASSESCQPYQDQAVIYRKDAQEKRDDAAANRTQASENRSQANKDRNKADNKREKGKEKKNDSKGSLNDAEDDWEDNYAEVFDDEDKDTKDEKKDELTDDGTLDKLIEESTGSNKKKK